MENIQEVIIKYQNLILKAEGVERQYQASIINSLNSKPLKIITGCRRSGKSFLVKQVLKQLIQDKKILLENILYLNLEDFALRHINNIETLNQVIEFFFSITQKNTKRILVLDEIQNIKEWDKLIRTLYEFNNGDYEIILTGSNSELLSSELGTNLAGRFVEFKIYPFSFKEFLQYQKLDIDNETDFLRHKEDINRYFHDYMRYGGLPEVFAIQEEGTKYSYIEGIISKVILDDVIERFKVKNTHLIEAILQYLLSNIGNPSNQQKIKTYIQSQGFDIDEDTLANYINYYTKTFLIYEVQKFDWKTTKVFNSSKKYYSVDLGPTNIYQPLSGNYGKQLENLVFLELKRRNPLGQIYYAKNGREIDFIVRHCRSKIFDKYQVTYELNSDNKEREVSAFTIADQYLSQGENFLLYINNATGESLECEGNFKAINLMKWLLLG